MESVIPIEHIILAVASAVGGLFGLIERSARQRHREQMDVMAARHKDMQSVFGQMITDAVRPLAQQIAMVTRHVNGVVQRLEKHEQRDEERFRQIGEELHEMRELLEREYGGSTDGRSGRARGPRNDRWRERPA